VIRLSASGPAATHAEPGRAGPTQTEAGLGERGRIEAAAALADADTEPGGDHLASRDYRRHLARVLTRRALERATRSVGPPVRVGGAAERGAM
jgi:CO/xanthine dehydrogenase FAD-binding subunit